MATATKRRAKPEHVSLTAQGKPVTLLEAIREGL